VRLLGDLRTLFRARMSDRLSTAEILSALHEMDDSPWLDFHGNPLNPRTLSAELGIYGVKVKTFKHNGTATKGYVTDGEHGLSDAWSRYLRAGGANGGQQRARS
jgi:hypothetical protein